MYTNLNVPVFSNHFINKHFSGILLDLYVFMKQIYRIYFLIYASIIRHSNKSDGIYIPLNIHFLVI